MIQLYFAFLGILLINSVYLLGKFIMSIYLGVHEEHIFLGYGENPALTFRIRNIKISLGLFIPFPWLAKFYKLKDGHKDRIRWEWEHFDQPIYKRLLVTFGGSFSMIVTSIIIFTTLEFHNDEGYISKQELNKFGIYPTPISRSQGFEKGDKIITINGEDYDKFRDLFSFDRLNVENPFYEVVRGSDTISVELSSVFLEDAGTHPFTKIFVPNAPFRIKAIVPGSRAEVAGLKEDDIITEIEEKSILSLQEFVETLDEHRADTMLITIKRQNEKVMLDVVVDAKDKIGFYSQSLIQTSNEQKSIFQAIQIGVIRPFELILINLKGLYQVLGGEVSSSSSLKGPINVAQLFDDNFIRFFRITALLMALATFYELIPFPRSGMLRCVPLISEIIGRKFSYQGFIILQKFAWLPVFALMFWSIMSDILKSSY